MSDPLKLGQIIEAGQQRDAIHVAVAPVIALERLAPGDHIGFAGTDQETVGRADGPFGEHHITPIGIVDPFLTGKVMKGERFWMFLYPQTITSLRHDWTHPAFEALAPTTKPHAVHLTDSEKWLRDHADALDLTYSALMRDADTWLNQDEHTVQHGSDHWRDTFAPTEFWHHYEIVTGTVVPEDRKHSFYCCSC